MGKSTISTGPFSSSQTVSLPEGTMYHHVCHGQNMVYVIYCDMVIPPMMWMLKMARTVYQNSMKMDWSPIPQWLGVYCNPTNLIMAHIGCSLEANVNPPVIFIPLQWEQDN